MSKIRYFTYRTAQSFLILFIVISLLFVLFRSMPGDMGTYLLAQGADPATVEEFRNELGLDEPLYVQYWIFLQNLIQGDLGQSMTYGVPVTEFIGKRIFNSAILVAPAITTGYLLGSLLGTIFGASRDRVEQIGIPMVLSAGTIPIFFLAILSVVLFSSILGIVPSSGLVSTSTSTQFQDAPWWRIYFTADFAHHFILPFAVIVARYMYLPTLLMRTTLDEVFNKDFYQYHTVTGLSSWRKYRHLLKHGSLPIVTYYPLSMTRAIGGMVLVEVIFNWPGIGYALVEAVVLRDFALLQGVFIIIAAAVIFGNYAVDIIYGFIDPRVSVEN